MTKELFKVYGHEFNADFAAVALALGLPETSARAVVSRGLTHIFGNEAASKVTSWKAALAEANPPVTPTESEVEGKKVEVRAAFYSKLMDGTIGVRASGGGLDPVEAEMERIARTEIDVILKANGYKFVYPKNAEGKRIAGEPGVVTLPDGKYTMDELIDRRIAKEPERIRADAEKAIKARENKKAKALAAAKGQLAAL